jgi:hypothetical protein
MAQHSQQEYTMLHTNDICYPDHFVSKTKWHEGMEFLPVYVGKRRVRALVNARAIDQLFTQAVTVALICSRTL